MDNNYIPKTNGSIEQLNMLSIDDLENELRSMTYDDLIKTCMNAI